MQMPTDEDTSRLLRMMPERYTWKACRLTRNLMSEGRSVPMKETLERLAIWHMKGQKECMSGFETLGGLEVSLALHTYPPAGFADLDTLLKQMKKGSWKNENKDPALEVEINATLAHVGSTAWKMNHAKLSIHAPPQSVATRLLGGRADLRDIIGGPYLEGFSIYSIWWKGEHWKNGEIIEHNPAGEMSEHLEIMLEGAHDYQPIRINP